MATRLLQSSSLAGEASFPKYQLNRFTRGAVLRDAPALNAEEPSLPESHRGDPCQFTNTPIVSPSLVVPQVSDVSTLFTTAASTAIIMPGTDNSARSGVYCQCFASVRTYLLLQAAR